MLSGQTNIKRPLPISAVPSGTIVPSGFCFCFLILNILGSNYLSPSTFSKGDLVLHEGVLHVPFLDKLFSKELDDAFFDLLYASNCIVCIAG